MEATTYHLKNNLHMHDQFKRIPKETKENSSWIHGDIFQQLHMNQGEKVTSNI
jgi:hypothetical protein